MALTAKQLDERQNYIGGSEVGAILGYNKFESALEVFSRKIDGINKEIKNAPVYWGNVLEPVIRDEFNYLLRTYENLSIHSINETKHHKDYDFLAANVDGIIINGAMPRIVNPKKTEHKAILEIKTVTPYMRKFWGEENHDLDCLKYRADADKSSGFKADYGEVPDSYYCQCAFYMSIYDLPVTYLAVYFGNDLPFKVYKIERDLEFEKLMIERLVDFWQNNVLKGIPPEPRTLADIIKLYPHGTPDKTVVATNEIVEKSMQYKELKEREKEAKAQAETIQGDLKIFMGNAERLVDLSGQKLHSWSRFETNKFQQKLLKEKKPKIYDEFCEEKNGSMFR